MNRRTQAGRRAAGGELGLHRVTGAAAIVATEDAAAATLNYAAQRTTWKTDSTGTTVTLNDAATATPWFDAPVPVSETEHTFEATARGRGTSGAGASKGSATAEVTVPAGRPAVTDVSVTSRPRDGTDTFKRGEHIEAIRHRRAVRAGRSGADVPARVPLTE